MEPASLLLLLLLLLTVRNLPLQMALKQGKEPGIASGRLPMHAYSQSGAPQLPRSQHQPRPAPPQPSSAATRLPLWQHPIGQPPYRPVGSGPQLQPHLPLHEPPHSAAVRSLAPPQPRPPPAAPPPMLPAPPPAAAAAPPKQPKQLQQQQRPPPATQNKPASCVRAAAPPQPAAARPPPLPVSGPSAPVAPAVKAAPKEDAAKPGTLLRMLCPISHAGGVIGKVTPGSLPAEKVIMPAACSASCA